MPAPLPWWLKGRNLLYMYVYEAERYDDVDDGWPSHVIQPGQRLLVLVRGFFRSSTLQ